MKPQVSCWKCGATLAGVPRPITRLSSCPSCRADLHVCRLCDWYDRKVLGECRHERADRILDKELANFCTHFRPRFGVIRKHDHAVTQARSELDALFGAAGNDPVLDDAAERLRAEKEAATASLSEMFGAAPGSADDAETGAAERAHRQLDDLFGK